MLKEVVFQTAVLGNILAIRVNKYHVATANSATPCQPPTRTQLSNARQWINACMGAARRRIVYTLQITVATIVESAEYWEFVPSRKPVAASASPSID